LVRYRTLGCNPQCLCYGRLFCKLVRADGWEQQTFAPKKVEFVLQLTQAAVGNGLLSRVSPTEFKALIPHLEWVDLKVREIIYGPNKTVDYAYFPVSGICSVIALTAEKVKAETGIIGREGFVGHSIVLYADSSPFETLVQLEGRALRISEANLQKAMTSHHGLLTTLLRFIHVFGIQTAQTAVANGKYSIPQRLARWLVMCTDRIDGYNVPMTHDFLAVMLAVRRAGVTDAVAELEGRSLIKAKRGNISILDLRALQAFAMGSYGLPEKEYKRLLGG
jgi:CRP-like cAMP-binding protein